MCVHIKLCQKFLLFPLSLCVYIFVVSLLCERLEKMFMGKLYES